ncbi:FRG domain-containing protein [Nonlabens sp. Hel1_33_55]|uniref:FRG domain-containing protein n=1 Tax=Nonlabens sp. Hel1_33_55 TaxID=1336802 RepID=UPI000875AEB4|nr:FRG domain-containing protein [Nonlabens sp. Hel1_33_55]SCX96518.1 FRG domain-containing protein [Nonlabens sp. Hel1_33_55]
MEIKEVKSLNAYTSYISKTITNTIDKTLWFRGSGNSNYKLTPTLHRHPLITGEKEILELESKIIQRFKQRSIPFLERKVDLKNSWEVLFYMQHFGTPTRLLDWSENPYVALYFACTSAKFKWLKGGKKEYDDDINVWLLDPVRWNRHALEDVSYKNGILSHDHTLTDSYQPLSGQPEHMRDKPIAIYGNHNSTRIVAQRGVFTIFGKQTTPMDTLVESGFANDALYRIDIPKNNVDKVLNSLISIGITDSTVFPDLDGLSKEIQRFYKFSI